MTGIGAGLGGCRRRTHHRKEKPHHNHQVSWGFPRVFPLARGGWTGPRQHPVKHSRRCEARTEQTAGPPPRPVERIRVRPDEGKPNPDVCTTEESGNAS